MQITHLGHAAVLVEDSGTGVLIDPGAFSDDWVGQTGLDAILVTHQHPDHLDSERLPALLTANPGARLIVEPETLEVARGLTERAETLGADGGVRIGGLDIRAVGGSHAVIHRDIPVIGNAGYRIAAGDGPVLFHPGDSLTAVPEGVDILALPVMGPWAAMKEHIDFVRAIGASHAFGIHDGLVNDRYWGLLRRFLAELADTQVADLRASGPTGF